MPPILRIALPALFVLILGGAIWWLLTSEEVAPIETGPIETEPAERRNDVSEPLGDLGGGEPKPREDSPEAQASKPSEILTVLNWVGGAVADAEVRQEGAVLGRSDGRGRLELPRDWSAEYPLEVRADGFLPWTGVVDASRTIHLSRALAVFGRVLTTKGDPVESFNVVATRFEATGVPIERGAKFRDGRFELSPLPDASHELRFSSPHHPSLTLGGIRPSPEPLTVHLSIGGEIQGRVVSSQDEPLSGFWVYALPATPAIALGPESGKQNPSQQTGPDGAFRFQGLSAGEYELVLGSLAEPIEKTEPIYVRPGDVNEHEFRLKASGELELSFRDASGQVLEGVQVRLYHTGYGYSRSGTTGDDGKFMADGLLIGSYRVSASLEGYRRFAHTYTVAGIVPQSEDITMQKADDR
ncbi:MAG: carboxypeptidase-like regulatory domain-containing protein [Planctomycetota bacterium]